MLALVGVGTLILAASDPAPMVDIDRAFRNAFLLRRPDLLWEAVGDDARLITTVVDRIVDRVADEARTSEGTERMYRLLRQRFFQDLLQGMVRIENPPQPRHRMSLWSGATAAALRRAWYDSVWREPMAASLDELLERLQHAWRLADLFEHVGGQFVTGTGDRKLATSLTPTGLVAPPLPSFGGRIPVLVDERRSKTGLAESIAHAGFDVVVNPGVLDILSWDERRLLVRERDSIDPAKPRLAIIPRLARLAV